MDFFAAQAAARRRERRFIVAYSFAVLAIAAAITVVVVSVLVTAGESSGSAISHTGRLTTHPGLVFLTALTVLGVIGVAALYRSGQLTSGGGAVARSLGGMRVQRPVQDPKLQRLLNVVEEMAIAAGLPVPEVYVLEQEPGINALAAGFSPADAAICVTRGTLARLNRAELQGVIGHEFSHILNGDMRLSTRLAGPLFGLLVIAIAGRMLLRATSGRDRRAGAVIVIGTAVMCLGYLGVFFGRLLQAAICRQQEFLADASCVQFTRDTDGLRDALAHVARSPASSVLVGAAGEDLAHLFLAEAYDRWYATHPPIAERIRALDSHFDLASLSRPEPPLPPEVEPSAAAATAAPAGTGKRSVSASALLAGTTGLSDAIGNPNLEAFEYAKAIRTALPPELEAMLAQSSGAANLWLALAVSAEPSVSARQFELVRASFGESVSDAVALVVPRVRALSVIQHLPLLQRALPALKAWPAERRRALIRLTSDMARAGGRMDVHEYLRAALATRYLSDQVDPPLRPGTVALDACANELGVLFAVLAGQGNEDPVLARRAYELGLASLLPRTRPSYQPPAAATWNVELDRALGRLTALAPAAKELLIDALGRTVMADQTVTVGEAELMRAVAALLHCPLPPLYGTAAGEL